MPVVSLDSLSYSGLVQTLKLLPSKYTQRPAYGMLGHLPVHSRDQHMVLQDDKGQVTHQQTSGAESPASGNLLLLLPGVTELKFDPLAHVQGLLIIG